MQQTCGGKFPVAIPCLQIDRFREKYPNLLVSYLLWFLMSRKPFRVDVNIAKGSLGALTSLFDIYEWLSRLEMRIKDCTTS